MNRKDTKRGRFYEVDGKLFPSVTSILSVLGKPALVGWAAKEERTMVLDAAGLYYEEVSSVLAEPLERTEFQRRVEDRLGKVKAHRKKLKEAGDIGTQVHNRIEWEIKKSLGIEKGERPELVHPKAVESYSKWEQWRDQTEFKPLKIEIPVRSMVFRYGGTADLLAEVNDPELGWGIEVIDWKTGKHIYHESFLQNGAYRMALKEMGIENDRGRIVRLPKEAEDPDFDTQVVPPLDEVIIPFLSLIPVWRWNRKMEDLRKAEHGRTGLPPRPAKDVA
jgi:hypothetical protein